MIFRLPAALLAVLAFAFQAPLAAQEAQPPIPAEIAAAFPDLAASDLPFDADYRVGQLDNGMRYVIRANATPPGQGMVQLWVDFGSAAEDEAEQGYAHFIEHMAFNGSTGLPEGEMVRLLEREGLAFGADTNASTGFDTTLYRLDLPRSDPALLDTALMLMREVASEVSFADDAVEREKGIILSERRVRDTYQLRSTIDNLAFLYPGSRISQRMPVGTVETIEAADGAALRALYRRWYRPENVALIVVGDYDAATVEAAIRAEFADWQGEPRLPALPMGPVDPAHAGASDVYLDPALSEEVTVALSGEWLGGTDTVQARRQRVLQQIGYGVVNRRLQRLARLEDPPFRGAGLGTADFFEEGRTTNLVVLAADGEWRRALAAAQAEYRRALAFGFSEGEVAEQVANLRQAIESNAAGAATRDNADFVTGAITLLRDGQVPTTPASALARWRAHEPEITPEAVLAALREDLVTLENPPLGPLIRFEGRNAPPGGEAELRAAWDEGMALALEAGDAGQAASFAYADFGAPGAVVSDSHDPRLGIRTLRFANGVMLNLRRTELDADRVIVQVNIDGGNLLDTGENPLATAMTSSLPMGGLGAHTLDELQSVLAGRQVSLNVASASETFRLSAATTPADLELQLRLFTAAILDPAFRPTGEAQYQRSVANWFAQRHATPASALDAEIGAIVSDNDPRFTLQPLERYRALSFAALRDSILERWQTGALELAMVGDLDEETAIQLVARTLGTLPPREADFGAYPQARQRSFTANRMVRTVYHQGQPNQAMLVMAWPTRDDADPVADLQLELLERVVRLQLIDVLREQLGQTYSPAVDADQSRTYPGYGTFDISAQVDTAQVNATRTAMLAVIDSLRAGPVSEDVLLRARQPLLEAYANALDSNGGWMALVDRAQSESERIDRFQAGAERLQAITAEDLRLVAERWLDPATRLEVTVLPGEVATAGD